MAGKKRKTATHDPLNLSSVDFREAKRPVRAAANFKRTRLGLKTKPSRKKGKR